MGFSYLELAKIFEYGESFTKLDTASMCHTGPIFLSESDDTFMWDMTLQAPMFLLFGGELSGWITSIGLCLGAHVLYYDTSILSQSTSREFI